MQLSEFFHQFGREVSFGQTSRLVNNSRPHLDSVLTNAFAQPTAQALHPQRLFVIAAKIFLEGDVLQPRNPLAQRMLLVGLPEKACVVEAGAQHTLVAMTNQPVGIAVRIQHRQKIRQQVAIRPFDSKIFLVVPHHRDQNFLRKLKKFRFKAAKNDRGPFGKIHNRFKQGLVFAPAGSGNRASGDVKSFADLLLALTTAQDPCCS